MSFSPGRSLVRQAENGTASSKRLHYAHLRAWLKAFRNDLRLDLIRPGASTRRPLQDLKTARIATNRS